MEFLSQQKYGCECCHCKREPIKKSHEFEFGLANQEYYNRQAAIELAYWQRQQRMAAYYERNPY